MDEFSITACIICKYKGHSIAYDVYGNRMYSVEHDGLDHLFVSKDKAMRYIDEITKEHTND